MRPIALLLVLAACAPGQTACERAALREFRIVDRLVDETRTNLARGYTYEITDAGLRTGFVFCSGSDNLRICSGNTASSRRRAVAIDPEAEQRKLERLEARREALATGAVSCQPR